MDIKVKIGEEEKVVIFKTITMRAQEEYLTKANTLEKENNIIDLLNFMKELVITNSNLTEEEYYSLSTDDGKILNKAIMSKLKPFGQNSDF